MKRMGLGPTDRRGPALGSWSGKVASSRDRRARHPWPLNRGGDRHFAPSGRVGAAGRAATRPAMASPAKAASPVRGIDARGRAKAGLDPCAPWP